MSESHHIHYSATSITKPNMFLKTMLDYSHAQVTNFGAQYYLFACFAIVLYGAPFKFWFIFDDVQPLHSIFLRGAASALSFVLLFKDVLPDKAKNLLPLYWYFVLMFCLPFLSTYMLLKNVVSYPWVFVCIFLLSALVDGSSFVLIFAFGCILALLLVRLEVGSFDINLNGVSETLPAYLCLLLIMIISLFLRNRDHIISERIKAYADLSGHIVHEIRKPLSFVRNGCEGWINNSGKLIHAYEIALGAGLIEEEISPLALNSLKKIPEQFKKITSDGLLFAEILLVQTQSPEARNDFVLTNAKDTIDKVLQRWSNGPERSAKVLPKLKNDFQYFGIPILLEHVFYELLRNSEYFFEAQKQPKITIWFSKTGTYNEIHFKDNGQGIPEDNLKNVIKSGFSTRPKGTGIGLSFCSRVLTQIGGKIQIQSEKNQFTEVILSFPKIRGEI